MSVKFIKPEIKPAQQHRLVKIVWDALAETGVCDSYGGSEYERCKPLVYKFVAELYGECNYFPVKEDKP